MRNSKSLIFLWMFFLHGSLFADIPYQVYFQGVKDKETLEVLQSVSQLYLLRDHPPATRTALRRRAEADIPNLKLGLQSLGFYDPGIALEIDEKTDPVHVNLEINPGPVYTLGSVEIIPSDPDSFPYSLITPEKLGLFLDRPIPPKEILEAEITLLEIMALRGFPLAKVNQKEVIADEEEQVIHIVFYVTSGPQAYFGPTFISGLECVLESAMLKKIRWVKGSPYHPLVVDQTLAAIEDSGLFSSVIIYPAECLNEEGLLPMYIDLTEGKHHTIGLGVSYNTQLGAGLTGEWENRNVRGRGERVSFRGELWFIRQRGSLFYTQPDFISPGQNLVWIAEAKREKTKGFKETFISLSSMIERIVNINTRFSYGVMFKQLRSEDTENDNGSFSLVKLPVYYHWTNADSVLDPTYGSSINYKLIPTFQVIDKDLIYFIQTITLTHYIPLTQDKQYILAQKISLGSIGGSSRGIIPAPERFYAGSENTLRGYRYLTVSPLSDTGEPIGGRSLLIYTLELRVRLNEKFGWIFFYDVGNVYTNVLPRLSEKQLNSIGYGIRYHTPVGPLRLDFAIPLNPRKDLDRPWELYLSIGQSF